jgi:hypothetical protein
MTGSSKRLCLKMPVNAMVLKCHSSKRRANARVIQNATPLTVHSVYSFCHVVVVASAAPLTVNKFHGSSLSFPSAVIRAPLFS